LPSPGFGAADRPPRLGAPPGGGIAWLLARNTQTARPVVLRREEMIRLMKG